MCHFHLSKWKFFQELRRLVSFPELEAWWILLKDDLGTAVLGSNQDLERPEIVRVRVKFLKQTSRKSKRQRKRTFFLVKNSVTIQSKNGRMYVI